MNKMICLILICCALVGCFGAASEPAPVKINPAHTPEDLSLCLSPSNIQLTNIEHVVDWINALPKPLTLACFIASLPRPLHYNATNSQASLQPALGKHNPRIFINYDKLWLSFVPQESVSIIKDPFTGERFNQWDADGIQLLELSLEVDSELPYQQSIKAELTFPILNNLPKNAPYARIVVNQNESTCKGCHANETVVDSVDGAPVFRSKMLRNTRQSELNSAELFLQYFACDPQINTGGGSENNEWYRCQMLLAFVDRGPIEWVSFRPEIFSCVVE